MRPRPVRTPTQPYSSSSSTTVASSSTHMASVASARSRSQTCTRLRDLTNSPRINLWLFTWYNYELHRELQNPICHLNIFLN